MLKASRFIIASCLTFIPLAACTQSSPTPLHQAVISAGDAISNLSLTETDYERFLAVRDVAELQFLSENPENQRDLILDYHSDRVLADLAEKNGLINRPIIQERIARARRQVLVTALMNEIAESKVMPADDDLVELARQSYLVHEQKYFEPEKRKVAHILLTDSTDCECAGEQLNLEDRMKDLQSRLAAGEDFAELAKNYSKDPSSAAEGGVISDWIQPNGKFVRAFEDSVFALKSPGDITEPFPTRFGLHVAKLLEIEPARKIEFEEVREQLIASEKLRIINSEKEKARAQAYPNPNSIDLDSFTELLKKLLAETKKETAEQ